MKECSKSITRRLSDPNFINRYFVGKGIDIGGKPDPLALYSHLFCQIDSIKTWDWEDGDAQYLESLPNEQFDFVHSSHCLEHLVDPKKGLSNWLRVIKPGGYLIVTVPDEDLYEQGIFPSTFNLDHKWTFTTYKSKSWSAKSINIIDLVRDYGDDAELIRLEQLSATYNFNLPRYDQTLAPIGESGIEFVMRRKENFDRINNGRLTDKIIQPPEEIKLHLNQYQDDVRTLKEKNKDTPPFMNNKDI